eukprot:gene9352-1439_t
MPKNKVYAKIQKILDDSRKGRRINLELLEEPYRSDPRIIMKAIEMDSCQVEFAPEEIKNNKEIALTCVKVYGANLQYFSEKLKNDKDVTTAAIQQSHRALSYVSEDLRDNREYMSIFMEDIPTKVYPLLSKRLKNDLEFIKIVVAHQGDMVAKIDDSFKRDEEFMLFAIQYSAFCYDYASTNLRIKKSFNLKCIEIQPMTLNYFSKEILTEDFLLEIVSKNGLCLEYLSNDSIHWTNENILLTAVKNNGLALKFINSPSKNLILYSIWNTGDAFEFVPNSFKNDEKFILDVVEGNGDIYQHISKRIKSNRRIALLSVKKSPNMFKFVPKILSVDAEIIWFSKRYCKLIRDLPVHNIFFYFD